MKLGFRKYVTATALMVAFVVFSSVGMQASAQTWLGAGLVYGNGIEKLGFQANGHMVVNEENNLRIGADFTYFFTDDVSSGVASIETSVFAINVNGHYMLLTADQMIVYGLGGLNIGIVSVKTSGAVSEIFNVDNTETEIGINIGGGVEYTVPFGRVYGELKYVLGGYDQLVIGAGVRIPLFGGDR